MILSSVFWCLTLAILSTLTYRRFGLLTAGLATVWLMVSAYFGKYVCDVGPTTWVALAFVLYWGAACTEKWFLTGMAIGLISFIDFKWAVPAGLSFVLIEFLTRGHSSFSSRVKRVLLVGGTALSIVGLAMLFHPPFARFWMEYVFPHSGLITFAPSLVFFVFLAKFGSAAGPCSALILSLLPPVRDKISAIERQSGGAGLKALIIAFTPTLFYVVFGELKAARFYAVTLPLIGVVTALGLTAGIQWIVEWIQTRRKSSVVCAISYVVLAMMVNLVLFGGSPGPAHHLSLPAGYQAAVQYLDSIDAKGSVASYNWPAVVYGWPEPFGTAPFAYLGLQPTDQWLALDPSLDLETIKLMDFLGQGREESRFGLAQSGACISHSHGFRRELC